METEEVKTIIDDYLADLYANEFENLNEMDYFPGKYRQQNLFHYSQVIKSQIPLKKKREH